MLATPPPRTHQPYESPLASLTYELSSAKWEIGSLHKSKDELNKQLLETQAKVISLEQLLSLTTQRSETSQEKQSLAEKNLRSLQQSVSFTKQNLQTSQEKLRTTEKESSLRQSQIEQLKDKVKNILQQLNHTNTNYEKIKTDLITEKRKVSSLSEDMQNAMTSNEQLKKELFSEKKKKEIAESSLEKTKKKCENQAKTIALLTPKKVVSSESSASLESLGMSSEKPSTDQAITATLPIEQLDIPQALPLKTEEKNHAPEIPRELLAQQNQTLIRIFQLPEKFHLSEKRVIPLFLICKGDLSLFRKKLTKLYWENTLTMILETGVWNENLLNSIKTLSVCVNSYYPRNHEYIANVMSSFFQDKEVKVPSLSPPEKTSCFIQHPHLAYLFLASHSPNTIQLALKQDPGWIQKRVVLGVFFGWEQSAASYDLNTLFTRCLEKTDSFTYLDILADTSHLDPKKTQDLISQAQINPLPPVKERLVYLNKRLERKHPDAVYFFQQPPRLDLPTRR